jgi:glycosyltransferase involved in cell wall biosynthesis
VNILLTHLHLDYPAGSETYTYTLVGALLRDHHQVQVVSPIRGLMAEHIHGLGARMLDTFESVEGIPDVLHCQHNIMAMAARVRFPETPMVYHSHGTLPLPEQPPSVDLNIQRVVAVSHLVKSHLVDRGVSPEAIRVLENPVDVRRFSPRGTISDSPRRALVLSNKMDPGTLGVIEAACRRLGIALEVLGLNGSLWEVEEHLNRADMVFSLGRGAIEAMACGRAVYVYDRFGADGWVTPGSIDEIASCTFSGKRYRRRLTAGELVGELKRYDAGMGAENRRLAEERYDIDRYLPRLLGVYGEAHEAFRPRSLSLPGQEIEVALTALAARIAESQNQIRELRSRPPDKEAPRRSGTT